jgi:hypothetical protein
MRIIEILAVFGLLAVILGGLSLPLWWNYAQPFMFRLPGYFHGVIRNIIDLIDFVLKSI